MKSPAGDSPVTNHHRETHDPSTRRSAIAAGALFLFATVTFLMGDVLIRGYFSVPAGAAEVGQLRAGVSFQILTAFAGAGIGVAMLPVLGRFSRWHGTGYLAFRSAEGVMIIGVGMYMLTTKTFVEPYELMIYAFTGVAGLILTYVLHASKLVAQWLARLGILGYIAVLLAIPSDLLNVADLRSAVGALFYAPGAVFELVLPILLIAKGFRRPEASITPTDAERKVFVTA